MRIGRILLVLSLFFVFWTVTPAYMEETATVQLPAELSTIEEEAFCGDDNLVDVIVPENTLNIEARAFADCQNLESIYIPDSVTSIAGDAFEDSPNVCIYCTKESVARLYAQSRNIDYYLTNAAPEKPVVSVDNPDMPVLVSSIEGIDDANGDMLFCGVSVYVEPSEPCDGFYLYMESEDGVYSQRYKSSELTDVEGAWYNFRQDFEPNSYSVWYTLYNTVDGRDYESEPSVPGYFDVLAETGLNANVIELEEDSAIAMQAVQLSWNADARAKHYQIIRFGNDQSDISMIVDGDESGYIDVDVVGGVTYTYSIYAVSEDTSGGDWTWSKLCHTQVAVPSLLQPIAYLEITGENTVTGGGTVQLTAVYEPAEQVDPQLTWSSSDESIATVDENGLVTASAQVADDTEVTITCAANDGSGLSAQATIIVENNRIYKSGNYNIYNISNTASYLNAWPDTMSGAWKSLLATSSNDDSAEQMFALEPVAGHYDQYRLRVMEYGGLYVSATTSGATTSTVSGATIFKVVPVGNNVCFVTTDGNYALTLGSIVSSSYSHQRFVMLSSYNASNTAQQWRIAAKSATLTTNVSSISLAVGASTTVTAYITSDGSDNDAPLVFSSSDSAVATVTGAGLVKAVGAGSATITVRTVSGISKSIPVTVSVVDTSNLPVIQFASKTMAVNENVAFTIPLTVSGYTGRFPVNMTVSEPTLDIVSAKFTSINQTLVQLGQSGKVYTTSGGRTTTTAKPNSAARTFYATGATMNIYLGGNYSSAKGNRTVTLTLNAPADMSYVVGENSTLTLTLVDVDGKRPNSKSGYTRAGYVAACLDWLKDKYPSGASWNHLVGAVNDDNCITSSNCSSLIHLSDDSVRSSSWCNGSYGVYQGATICNENNSYSSSQCFGFALKVASDVFGSTPINGSGWTLYTSYSSAGGFQAGDYVRVSGHSFFVTGVSGNVVNVIHCNYSWDNVKYRCGIVRTGDSTWANSYSTISFWQNQGIQQIYRYTGWNN